VSTKIPTKTVSGWGVISKLRELLDLSGYRSATILVGKSSLAMSGQLRSIELDLQGLVVHVVSGVGPMPTLESIEQLVRQEKAHPLPHVVIGIGGGSVLDSAKCLAILLVQRNSLRDILAKRDLILPKAVPCVAVPTTAGTGSEVTSQATIWDLNGKKKYSLKNECMYPEYAILDPALTLSLPPRITAITGLDALTHALEAAYSIHSTPETDIHALQAINAIMTELENVVVDGSNRRAREVLLQGSLHAGLAIARTSTAAAHAVSYPLTIHYGIPHGYAVGLLVPEFLMYNSGVNETDCQDPRGVAFVLDRCKLIATELRCSDIVEARNKLRQLIAKIGLKTSLRELGVTDLELISRESTDPDRVSNQPRLVTEQNVRSLLREIYQ